jgi:dTDP-4-dehydrorhamnose reductase
MKILLFGNNGQLGWELERCLSPLGELTALDYPEINFSNPDNLRQIVRQVRPDVLVNPAAHTAVDKAESEPDLAMAINGTAPGVLAEEIFALGGALIHYSTDYVFDGTKGSPYIETDPPNPLNIYGRSKLAGERAVEQVGGTYLILRTSWVYSTRVGGFVNKVLEWSRQQRVLRVVEDQVGCPTWCRMLAETTALLLAKAGSDPAGMLEERKGLYHLAGSGSASRLEWAREILQNDQNRDEQAVKEIQPAKTSEFPTPAARPLYAPMNCERFSEVFNLHMPDWKQALKLAMETV